MTALHRRSQGVKAKNANARRSRGNRTRQRFCITRERGCRLQLRAVNAWAIGRGARYRRGCSPGSPDQPGVQSIPFLPMASRKRTSQTTNRGSTPRSRNISSRGQIPRVARSWLALAAAVENRTLELLPGLRGSTTPKLLVLGRGRSISDGRSCRALRGRDPGEQARTDPIGRPHPDGERPVCGGRGPGRVFRRALTTPRLDPQPARLLVRSRN